MSTKRIPDSITALERLGEKQYFPPSTAEELDHSLLSKTNPKSVYNLVPKEFRTYLDTIPEELLVLEEKELKSRARARYTEDRLRVCFWMEYERSLHETRPMTFTRVYGGVCTANHFYANIASNPDKLAYILTPPVKYEVAVEEALVATMEQLREVVELPNLDAKGRPDAKLIEAKIKIFTLLDLRSKGAIVNRNVNVNITESKPPNEDAELDMEVLSKKIKELEEKAMRLGAKPSVVGTVEEAEFSEIGREKLDKEIESRTIVVNGEQTPIQDAEAVDEGF